jgi:hypothetical protein
MDIVAEQRRSWQICHHVHGVYGLALLVPRSASA